MKQFDDVCIGRFICAATFWIILFGPLPIQAQDNVPKLVPAPDEAIEQFSTAANAQNGDEFNLAAELWESILNKFPNTELIPSAQYYAGVCRMKLGQLDQAATHFNACATKWDKVPAFSFLEDALLNLGGCQFSLAGQAQENPARFYDQAAATFARLAKQFPKGKYIDQAFYFQGESLYLQDKKEAAIAPYSQLIHDAQHRESSLRPNGLYALGVAYEELQQYSDAAMIYDAFLKEFPKHELSTEIGMRKAETVRQAGLTAKNEGKLEAAESLFDQAAKMFGNAAAVTGFDRADHAIFQQALCYIELGKSIEAAKLYERLVSDFSKSAYVNDARLNAGRFYYRGASYQDAMKWLQEVIKEDAPNAPEAAHWMCRIHLRNGDAAKAIQLADQLLPKAGKHAFGVNLLMDRADGCFDTSDRKSEALDQYLKIATDYADHDLAPQALYNAAFAAKELKRYDDGAKYCDNFLARFKEHQLVADVQYVDAECHLFQQQYDQAESAYRNLLDQYNGHTEFEQWQVRLGLVVFLQEKFADVIGILSPAIGTLKSAEHVAEAQLLIGKSQFYLNKHAEAVQAFQASLAASGQWRQADETLLLWSQSLHQLEKTDEAINKVRQLLDDFPQSGLRDQAHYRLGEYSYAKEDFKTAVEQYGLNIEKFPQSPLLPYAYYGKGWSLLKQSEFTPAVETFTALLAKHGSHQLVADTHFARGMCRRQVNDLAGAVEDFVEFLKSNPDKTNKCNALYEKGLAEVGMKQFQPAIKSFADVLTTDPQSAVADKALYELAWAHKVEGQESVALTNFQKLVDSHPNSPLAAEANFHVGEHSYQQKEYADAVKSYVVAKQKAVPGSLHEKILYKLGWSYYQLEQFNPALKEFIEQTDAYSNTDLFDDGVFMVAECLFRLRNFEEALPAYTKALTAAESAGAIQDNVQGTILLHGGQSAMELKKYQEALDFLKQIPANDPQSGYLAEAQLEIGRAHQSLGNVEEAVKAFEQAATKSRGQVGARARFMIGELHFQAKDHEEATKQFQLVIFGYGGDRADDQVKNWQAKSGYEAARCAEIRISSAKDGEIRSKLIADARKFYNYVITKHAKHELAASAKKQLDLLERLQ